ncbi:MAG TPA: branched-chain amino acid transaminase [Candidatus Saccharimonadales bacterium]|nr:branched-chain amino acid transaminase [Candidatus Saccharimonadales bacterium]
MKLQTSHAYLRDKLVPFAEANLSIASAPVLYGLSVYTVFSANWDEATQKLLIFRLQDHYLRLINSAKIMDFHDFADTWTYKKFEKVMTDLLKTNKVDEDVLVRVTVFVDAIASGTRMHGLKNSLSAYVYPLGEVLPLKGIHACVSSWQRTADNAIPSRAKVNGSYINASLMKNEALLNGYDEAIAIDEHGHVSEGTIANLFIVKNGVLITPDTATDMLEGITRDSVLKLAAHLNMECEQRTIDRSELYTADEAFMCGSSARITPVLSVDKRLVGSGKIGPITQKLTTAYEQAQRGNKSAFAEWRLAV